MSNAFMTADAAAEISVVCSSADDRRPPTSCAAKNDPHVLEREVNRVLSAVLSAVRDEALQGHFVASKVIDWSAWEDGEEERLLCRPKELVEAVAYRLMSLGYRCSVEPDDHGWKFRVCW